jgi:hypothetical protein
MAINHTTTIIKKRFTCTLEEVQLKYTEARAEPNLKSERGNQSSFV